jgi:hypothetical protein
MAHYVDPADIIGVETEATAAERARIEDLAARGFVADPKEFGRYANCVTLTEDFLVRVNARSVTENARGESMTTVELCDRWGMIQFSVSFATKELAERYKPGTYFKLQAVPGPPKA